MNFEDFFDRDSEHHARMSKAIAALPVRKGLDASMLDVGDVVTFGRNKVNGDRSYIDSVWEVMAANGFQIQLKRVGGAERSWCGDKPIMLMGDEHEFYDGRVFMDSQ